MGITVATSKVTDGSMYNRHDMLDGDIIRNREIFLAKQGMSLDQSTRAKVDFSREDYCRYIEVGSAQKGAGMRDNNCDVADALITTENDVVLFLPIADCVGTVLYDPSKQVLALAHLGRHSLEQDGGQKIVDYLRENYGVNARDLKVWLTPAPNKELYPIWALANKGMKEVVFDQLQNTGILLENIIDNPADSATDPDYFSYTAFYNGLRKDDGDYAIVAMMTD